MSGPAGRTFAADPVVEVPTELPPAWQKQLVSCVVDENAGLPDSAELVYRDPDHELLSATELTIGSPVVVSVVTARGQAGVKLFTGEVTAVELDMDSTGSFTVVRALSKAHRLFRGRKVVAFRNMTVAAIVRKVAKGAGLTCGRIDATGVTHAQISQAGVSDWDFLQHLASENGVVLSMDDRGRLELVEPRSAAGAPAPSTPATSSPFVLEYGRNLLSLRAALTAADGVGTVEVRGWNPTTKKPLVAREPAVRSNTVQPGLTGVEAGAPFGTSSRFLVTDTPYRTQAETTAAARSVAASISASLGEVEAVVAGDPALRAGVPVALGNVGAAFSGRYTATAVRHVLEPQGGYRTTVVISASTDRSLTGLITGASAPARSPRMPGLAIGVVTDVREPGREGRGSVKLRFPWLSDDYVTDWVRTVQFGGRGGGGVLVPEVNDEVLVGFEQGSLDHPYVLGGLYNGVDAPSPHDVPLVDRTSGRVNRRSLVSRSGNRVELLDTPRGVTGVRLATGNGRLEVLLNERGTSAEITVRDRTGRRTASSLTLTDRGITLDAGTGTLELSGRSVTINGRADVQVDGGLLAVLKARLIRIN
ncbi:VgrG-related protein [Umezawaea beigongshangensis]|uniref:VgrG-related protein n=1 Tax=Umezawaea beigongshangensis TaxID=2780383 RepID=UPI0018F1B24D|nr:VgrG-related protein [Umezawaea beigongshangensis]